MINKKHQKADINLKENQKQPHLCELSDGGRSHSQEI